MARLCGNCKKWKVFSKNLCRICWLMKFGKPPNKISDNHRVTLDEYSEERKVFLENNPVCGANGILEGCTYYATVIHHKKGKHSKKMYLNKKYWMASCVSCNGNIETIGQKAYDLGLRIRHNTKED